MLSRSIYVAANGISFFFIAEQYPTVYMYHISFIQSSCQWTFKLLLVLAIVNSAAVIIRVHSSHFELCFAPDRCPEVGLLDCMVVLSLVFWVNAMLFSTVAAPIYISTNSIQRFQVDSTFSTTFMWPFWWLLFRQVWGDTSLWFWFAVHVPAILDSKHFWSAVCVKAISTIHWPLCEGLSPQQAEGRIDRSVSARDSSAASYCGHPLLICILFSYFVRKQKVRNQQGVKRYYFGLWD